MKKTLALLTMLLAAGCSYDSTPCQETKLRANNFDFYDMNGDGFITAEELQKGVSSYSGGSAAPIPAEYDHNGDSVLSKEEFVQHDFGKCINPDVVRTR